MRFFRAPNGSFGYAARVKMRCVELVASGRFGCVKRAVTENDSVWDGAALGSAAAVFPLAAHARYELVDRPGYRRQIDQLINQKGWKCGPITMTSAGGLKDWLKPGETKKPFAGQQKEAQAKWRSVENLRKLFKHFSEMRGPGGGLLHTPAQALVPGTRGTMAQQLNAATRANVKRILSDIMDGGSEFNGANARMRDSATRFVTRLPGDPIKGSGNDIYSWKAKVNSDKLLFRGLDMRRKPKTGNDAGKQLFWGGGYFANGVHATPSLRTAYAYGSPHKSTADLHLTAVYKQAPFQKFFDDWGLETAVRATNKSSVPPSTLNAFSPRAYETLARPDKNPAVGLLAGATRPGSRDDFVKMIRPDDARSLRAALNYTLGNSKRMAPLDKVEGKAALRLNALPSKHQEAWDNLLERRIQDRLMPAGVRHSSFIEDLLHTKSV